MSKPMKKLVHNVETICNNYFLDLTELETAGAKPIEGWKIASMMLSAAMQKDMLILGEPGWGKTTATSIVSAATTGLPMDLFRNVLIRGHPEQSEEKMIARLDFGKLYNEGEHVIMQKQVYFPIITLDEFNRLPEGKQSEFLDCMATGIFSYLNENFYRGKKTFFATVNYSDGGNHKITPANLDRFHLSAEFSYQNSVFRNVLERFSNAAKQNLRDNELTLQILAIIKNDENADEKLAQIEKLRQKHLKGFMKRTRLQILTEAEFIELRKEIASIELDQDAEMFLNFVDAEINTTGIYGAKRSCDEPDSSTHGKQLASYNITNGLSPRGSNEAIMDFAKALALYQNAMNDNTGKVKATKAHVEAVMPYALAHRLNFTDDYRSQHTTENRDCMYEMHLARTLIEEVGNRYSHMHNNLVMLYEYEGCLRNGKNPADGMNRENCEKVEDMITDANKIDHPFARQVVKQIKVQHAEQIKKLTEGA